MRNGPSPAVLLCGVGADPPATLALDVLERLHASPRAFWFGGAPPAALRPYLPRLRRARRENELLKAARGGDVVVALLGHPVLANPAGCRLLAACARQGLRCRVLASNSALGTAIVLGDRAVNPSTQRGLDAVSLQALERSDFLLDAGEPVVVFDDGALDPARLGLALAARPCVGRKVWLFRAGRPRPRALAPEALSRQPPADWALVGAAR